MRNKKLNKSLNELKKVSNFKNFVVILKVLMNIDDEYRKIGSISTLLKEFNRNYYKPIRADGGFTGINNNYIEYKSKGDR